MSLAEKLANKSKELEQENLLAEKQAEDNELAPVRNKIVELEELRGKLDLIKGSLELKKGDKIDDRESGKGMKEYSDQTNQKTKDESTKIDSLIEENKEALQKMGIENKEELIENPEFAEETEVVNYKKAKEEGEGLGMSDQALQDRLVKLEVNIEGEFSYDIAEKTISEKIKLIDSELSQEKLKTPEGKEEAISKIADSLKESLPKTFFSFDEKLQGYRVSVSSQNSYNKEEMIVRGEKVSFENWYRAGLIPKNIDELEEKYGKEVIKLALKKVYEDKTKEGLKNLDQQNEKNYSLKEKLEKDSPEKGMKAKQAFNEFSKLQNQFKNIITEKSEELKKKGITFNPISPAGYGATYEELTKLASENDIGEIDRGLSNVSVFPPKFDYEKLQLAIEKKSENLKGLIDSIRDISTEEDVKKFLFGEGNRRADSTIGNFHGSMLRNEIRPYNFNSSFKQEIEQAQNNRLMNTPAQILVNLGIKTFDEAEKYLNHKIGILEKMKGAVLDKINIAVEAKLKQKELEDEIEKNNFGLRSNIDSEISRIEQNKKDAIEVLTSFVKLEAELPQEEVILEGDSIMVPSVKKEIDELIKTQKDDEEKLKIVRQRNTSHKNKAPTKVLGVTVGEGQWKKEQEEIKEQSDLEAKIKTDSDKISKLYNKLSYRISTKQYSDVEKLVKEQKSINGVPSEIFKELRIKLNELMEQKVPESIVQLSNEYKDLKSKLK